MNQYASDVVSRSWDGFRLSKQQEHILARTAGELTHRTVAHVRLTAPVDRATLEHAARDVAMAHESLRTTYRKVLGENSTVLMVIEDEPRIHVSESTGSDTALTAILDRERRVDQDDAGLVRLILFAHTGGGHSLVMSALRLSIDTASVEIFFRDLRDAYTARSGGTSWQPAEAVQYADYSQWQFEEGTPNERQKKVAADRAAQLADLPPLRLPLELRATGSRHESLEWTVPAPLARQLRQRGEEFDGGLRGVLLTAWLAALWHATGRPDGLAVDVTLTRRPFHEMVTAIGHFENPMPVFATISAEMTLAELLRTVGLELDSHEHAAESAMDPATQCVQGVPGFRFSDVAEFTAPAVLTFADLRIEPTDDARKVALWAQGVDGDLRLTLRHQAGGMAEGGAEALLVCLRAAVQAVGEHPSAALGSLAMLDEQAVGALVTATNSAGLPARGTAHWHRQVERTADRVPDAIALRTATRTWTYREFDQAANRLAGELIDRGVRAGDLVGLCLERSDLAIVAMLAIAKAGAGYVPVDPNLPAKRRSAIVASARLTHAVATGDTAGDLPPDCHTALVDENVYGARDGARPDVATTDDGPAYVLFTSGSTGAPKGVLVGHGQLAAYLAGVLDRLGLTGEIDSVALGTLGTDLGNTALFPPLLSGGQLVVVSQEVSSDAQALAELLARETFDLVKMTPSHLDALFAVAEAPEAMMPRKALVLGGEPWGWGSYNLFQGFLGDCKLFNHYGPTETTVGVLCGQITSNQLAGLTSTIPLGTPMRHARAYVLDPNGMPLPVGVPGELWIGGNSVSQGYLAGTADQRERFVADPFSPAPSARMYRSGDRARVLPDHTIEFLGRMDRQIKVRGFRVELGEIEAVMRQHPRVTSSLVVERGESTAAHLVGYLIDADGSRGSAGWLGEYLAERLPEFMIPAHFVALETFPLTSTGKVDASLLPEPGTYSEGASSYVPPRTPTEERVAGVMAKLLLLQRVGADDDFFDIGGHSLLATQLIARLREEFELSFKLRTLFEYPVVSELAEHIDQLTGTKAGEA